MEKERWSDAKEFKKYLEKNTDGMVGIDMLINKEGEISCYIFKTRLSDDRVVEIAVFFDSLNRYVLIKIFEYITNISESKINKILNLINEKNRHYIYSNLNMLKKIIVY